MRVKEDFFSRGTFKVGNGENTRFWEDTWLGDKPLAQQYPIAKLSVGQGRAPAPPWLATKIFLYVCHVCMAGRYHRL
jgi:hypothetical protein